MIAKLEEQPPGFVPGGLLGNVAPAVVVETFPAGLAVAGKTIEAEVDHIEVETVNPVVTHDFANHLGYVIPVRRVEADIRPRVGSPISFGIPHTPLGVMERDKLIHLVTNDRDFERVSGIKVWLP